MPRKTPKPRKPGQSSVSVTKDRRARPVTKRQVRPDAELQRGRRIGGRPPRFPGRLGGR